MSTLSLTIGTLLFGVVLAAIAVVVTRRGLRSYDGGQEREGLLQRLAASPMAWMVGFFLLIALTAGGALAYVMGMSMLSSLPGGPAVWVGGLFGVVVAVYLFWGVYQSSRYKGLHRPAAIMVVSWVVGSLVLAVISLKLLGFV